VQIHHPAIICLQETKPTEISPTTISNCLGPELSGNYWFLLPIGTRGGGGLLLACKNVGYQFSDICIRNYTIPITLLESNSPIPWSLTGVYGHQEELEKRLFLSELRELKHQVQPVWLIVGDLNLIYQDSDQNNSRINMCLMSCFHRDLNHLEVREIQLLGRWFTWSNRQGSPTMTRIDRTFCTVPWEESHSDPPPQVLSSSASDHPIHLTSQ
jgi:hypothetical protein